MAPVYILFRFRAITVILNYLLFDIFAAELRRVIVHGLRNARSIR